MASRFALAAIRMVTLNTTHYTLHKNILTRNPQNPRTFRSLAVGKSNFANRSALAVGYAECYHPGGTRADAEH